MEGGIVNVTYKYDSRLEKEAGIIYNTDQVSIYKVDDKHNFLSGHMGVNEQITRKQRSLLGLLYSNKEMFLDPDFRIKKSQFLLNWQFQDNFGAIRNCLVTLYKTLEVDIGVQKEALQLRIFCLVEGSQ